MKKGVLSMLLVCTLCAASMAQAGFQKIVGTESRDEGYAVVPTPDSGYYVAGITYPPGSGCKAYLIRFDKWGNHIWMNTLGEDGETTCKSIYPTRDGGYILGGYFSKAGTSPLLIKIDSTGNQQWSKTYGDESGNSYGYSAQQTADGGYIICGSTFDKNAGDVYIVKTDAAGNLTWQKTYGGSGADVGYSIQQTKDGGFIIAGQTTSFGHTDGDMYLLKTDADGNEQWAKTFGGKYSDIARCVRQTADGGFILTGDIGNKSTDVCLLKTDDKGKKLWEKTFGGTDEDHGYTVEETADGGYIIGGYTKSFKIKLNDRDFYLIKTDSKGTEQWHKTFGGTGEDSGVSCKPALDGGYIFAGSTDTNRSGWNDVMLVKTDAGGNP